MNAPAVSAALEQPTITMIPLGALRPSTTHIQELRRARFDPKLIGELAESIRAVGVLQPILTRRSQANGRQDVFEIVAGERRFLAAKKAGVADIPATVRDLSDEQVLEVQLIENLQREGLHELEEAEGYEELMKLKKISADAVADMVGKSRSYVFKRTKLLALCPEARKAFYAGELDASKALLIARIGHHDTQRQALKDISENRFGDGAMTFREAQEHIQQEYMLRLKEAPFDINDATLVAKAGSCQACPKRTGNQKELFGDVKSGDVCTDPKCFDDKRQAHYLADVKQLEAKGKKVVHGDAAKKVFPHWKNGSSSMGGGYLALNDSTYVGGRHQKVKDVLEEDYEPILVQHPATGKIIEVATQQAVAKASQSPSKGKTRKSAKAKGPAQPDIDDVLTERLAQLIHKNAPKQFGKAWFLDLAKGVYEKLNLRDEDAVATAWGWPKSAFRSGYGSKLPAQAAKLGERDLVLLMFDLIFASRWGRESVLKLFGIKEHEVRELIIEERKAARAKKAK